MTPATGVLLGERYLLTDRIAGGGMGEVWRASDQVLGREVAVKVLRREYADDPTFLERFRGEARHTAGLSHPGIATVYDYGEDDSPYLVMEHVPGEPLSAVISRHGAMAPERVLDMVGQSALALQAAHDAGVIHRDVKPGNLMVRPDGTVKVTDFGIARAADSAPLTRSGAIMGTAYYMAPEQVGGGTVTPASDIYSLGVVAYECLAGRRPFDADTPVGVALAQVREAPPDLPTSVPPPVRDLVMRMLAKDPAARPASAGELGRETQALAAGAGAAVAGTARTASTAGPAATMTLPAGDTDPGPGLPPPPTGRGRLGSVGYVVLAALLALLLVLSVRACSSGATNDAPPTSGRSTPESPAEARTVDLDDRAYLGRPADDVEAELEDAGLRVERTRGGTEGRVGTVDDVSPTGTVEEGSLVTLSVVPARPDEEAEERKDERGKGNGRDKGKGDD
ncbi:MAG: serine/threonine protein kinase [Actinomycetes bacterium]